MASRSAGPLIYKVFRCLHLPCTGMAGGKGRRAYCLFFLRRILWSDRTKESVKMFLAPEWLEEKVGEHTVCPSCGESCGVIDRTKRVGKNVPCTGMAGGKGRRAYCLSFLRRILWSDRTKRAGKNVPCTRMAGGKGRGAYGLSCLCGPCMKEEQRRKV